MKKKIKKDHIHLYKRIDLVPKWKQTKLGREPYLVFICEKPGCTHRMPLDQAIGKICECRRCGEPFVIDKITVDLAKPHCQDCIVKRNKPELDKISELIKDI